MQLDWLTAAREHAERPRARRTDPATSHIAAARIARRLRAQQQAVLDAVKRYPGSTAVELAQAAELDRYVVSRRLPELVPEFVRRHAPRVCRVNGTAQCTWYPA